MFLAAAKNSVTECIHKTYKTKIYKVTKTHAKERNKETETTPEIFALKAKTLNGSAYSFVLFTKGNVIAPPFSLVN